MKHGNTGNQNAVKPDSKRATINIRVRQSSKDKAQQAANRSARSLSQYIEDLINK